MNAARIDRCYYVGSMRAFYSTEKNIRAFILGSPEGWQVAFYDLQKRRWTDMSDGFHGTLKEAKTAAHQRTEALLGKKLASMKWH